MLAIAIVSRFLEAARQPARLFQMTCKNFTDPAGDHMLIVAPTEESGQVFRKPTDAESVRFRRHAVDPQSRTIHFL